MGTEDFVVYVLIFVERLRRLPWGREDCAMTMSWEDCESWGDDEK